MIGQHPPKVLVVEDSLLIADVIKETLEDQGYEVIGPVPRLEQGLKLAEESSLDGAFLDINLAGDMSFPIASALSSRGVPFIFLTGYDDPMAIPPDLRSAVRLKKPFDVDKLAIAVAALLRPPN